MRLKIKSNKLPDRLIVRNLSSTLLTHQTKTMSPLCPNRIIILLSRMNTNTNKDFKSLKTVTNLNLRKEITIIKRVWENLSLPIALSKQLYPKLLRYQKHQHRFKILKRFQIILFQIMIVILPTLYHFQLIMTRNQQCK